MKVSGFEKFILLFNFHAYSNVSCLDREGDVLQLMVSDLDTSHSSIEKNQCASWHVGRKLLLCQHLAMGLMAHSSSKMFLLDYEGC